VLLLGVREKEPLERFGETRGLPLKLAEEGLTPMDLAQQDLQSLESLIQKYPI
jgi:hypothetical protein